jgi:hypothetical protein
MTEGTDSKLTSTADEKEVDRLRYSGNDVPRVIRLFWTLMAIFTVYYLGRYMVPDLGEWLKK